MSVAKFQRWSGGLSNKGAQIEHRPNDAATRLISNEATNIYNDVKFKLDRTAKVFCIGSCFAREIKHALKAKDIIIANSYSKSLLRTVAQQVSQEHANADYFPSYEIVTSSQRESAWENDQRHVKSALVKQITDKFIYEYLPET